MISLMVGLFGLMMILAILPACAKGIALIVKFGTKQVTKSVNVLKESVSKEERQ